jgi:hypothetical protein
MSKSELKMLARQHVFVYCKNAQSHFVSSQSRRIRWWIDWQADWDKYRLTNVNDNEREKAMKKKIQFYWLIKRSDSSMMEGLLGMRILVITWIHLIITYIYLWIHTVNVLMDLLPWCEIHLFSINYIRFFANS